jgi:predicted neuraminidase
VTRHPPAEVDAGAIAPAMTGRLGADLRRLGRLDAFLPSPCVQNHAANLAWLPDGSLACVWFGGSMEGRADISVYMSRLAPGSDRWSDPVRMTDDPAKSEQNPILFVAPDGRVILFYTSQTAGDQDGAVVKARVSHDGGRSFGPVTVVCDEPGTFVRQPVVVNGAGAWLLPAFRCVGRPGRRWTGDVDTAAVLVSDDGGRSFAMVPVPESLGAVHMNVVDLPGGNMVAFYRDRYADRIRRSRSRDDGLTWSAPEPTGLANNNASIQAVRLADGAIAVAYNDASAASSADRRASLYDEIGEGADAPPAATSGAGGADGDGGDGPKAVWGVPRAPLSLAVSTDGGETFAKVADLETGPGTCLSNNSEALVNREFSYPSLVEGPDGALHLAYTVYRRAIRHVRLEPGWRRRLAD